VKKWKEKCTKQLALNAAKNAKSLSSHLATDRFIAGNAIEKENHEETDIKSFLGLRLFFKLFFSFIFY